MATSQEPAEPDFRFLTSDGGWNPGGIRRRLREMESPDFERAVPGTYRYPLDPVVPEAELLAFERANGITLPDSYRTFLTTVGGSGAGPFSGLYRYDGSDLEPGYGWAEERRPGWLARPFPHAEFFAPAAGTRVCPEHAVEQAAECEEYEEFTYDPCWLTGSLTLADYGCGSYCRLVVTGEARGQVWLSSFGEGAGIAPGPDFRDWYVDWLDDPDAITTAASVAAVTLRW